MGYIDHVHRCNQHDLSLFQPFTLAESGQILGWVRHDVAALLAGFPQVFTVADDRVMLVPGLKSPTERTDALAAIAPDLIAAGLPGRQRGEMYAVKSAWSAPESLRIDRGLSAAFGIKAYGVHLNGYVRRPDGGLSLWIGRRAPDKAVEPDKLDNMVAGGQPAGLSLTANLIKEAAEEATVPASLMDAARPVGAITYCMDSDGGLKPDTMFCYDVELPDSFVPVPADDEMSGFTLMPVEDVLTIIRTTFDFKFNVALVILDFALRHGLLNPDTDADYEALLKGLRAPHPAFG